MGFSGDQSNDSCVPHQVNKHMPGSKIHDMLSSCKMCGLDMYSCHLHDFFSWIPFFISCNHIWGYLGNFSPWNTAVASDFASCFTHSESTAQIENQVFAWIYARSDLYRSLELEKAPLFLDRSRLALFSLLFTLIYQEHKLLRFFLTKCTKSKNTKKGATTLKWRTTAQKAGIFQMITYLYFFEDTICIYIYIYMG